MCRGGRGTLGEHVGCTCSVCPTGVMSLIPKFSCAIMPLVCAHANRGTGGVLVFTFSWCVRRCREPRGRVVGSDGKLPQERVRATSRESELLRPSSSSSVRVQFSQRPGRNAFDSLAHATSAGGSSRVSVPSLGPGLMAYMFDVRVARGSIPRGVSTYGLRRMIPHPLWRG